MLLRSSHLCNSVFTCQNVYMYNIFREPTNRLLSRWSFESKHSQPFIVKHSIKLCVCFTSMIHCIDWNFRRWLLYRKSISGDCTLGVCADWWAMTAHINDMNDFPLFSSIVCGIHRHAYTYTRSNKTWQTHRHLTSLRTEKWLLTWAHGHAFGALQLHSRRTTKELFV